MDDVNFIPLLSVIVVGHNDDREAAPLIAEIRKALQGHVEYEIIYVDDGSTDGTFHSLSQVASWLSLLRIVQLSRTSGPTVALMAGITAARGTWVVTLDGRGANDPADIPAMFEMAMQYEGHSPLLVAGHRGGAWKSAPRQLIDGVAGLARRLLLGEDADVDSGCNFVVCARDLWTRLPWFDHLHRYLPVLVKRAGGRIISIPINYRTRPKRSDDWGKVGAWRAWRDLLGVRWLQARPCIVDPAMAPVIDDSLRVRSRAN